MSVVDSDGNSRIVMNGETLTVPYRKAAGLVSLGRAVWYTEPKRKKTTRKAKPSGEVKMVTEHGPESVMSAPAKSGAEGDEQGNEPAPTDP